MTIQIRGIAKSYGGVHALHPMDLDIQGGEVHALCGENGAGKSTLNRILAGIVAPDAGSVELDGVQVELGSVVAAEQNGIAIVHQESGAFLELSATDNCQLMREPGALWVNRGEMRRRTVESLAEVGEAFDPDVLLEDRSVAQRQMVAIARAVSEECRLLILDEPTSSLSARESEALFDVVRRLRGQGVAILYVSHRLDEIFELADRVSVLRDGVLVASQAIHECTPQMLVQQMVGRTVEFVPRESCERGRAVLDVIELSGHGFRDVSFSVRAGEVVALSGLIGAGRSEVARAIFGLEAVLSGQIWVNGKMLSRSNQCAIESGIALVPEDRQHEGLHLPLSVLENLMMAASPDRPAIVQRSTEYELCERMVSGLGVKTQGIDAEVSSLSGGNQQKVLLGKWLAGSPKVLILDEPTRGVDVGAKDQIHRLIGDLTEGGVAILLISSEMNEVLALADRILVMRQGRVAGELDKSDATKEALLTLSLPQETDAPILVPRTRGIHRELAVGGLLAAIILLVSTLNPSFLGAANIVDLLVRMSPALIMGTFMTLLILAREIDISIGSLMGLCAATLGIAASSDRMGLPVPVAVAACLGVGAIGGLLNGILVAYARIPSIIVTLGTLTLFRGVTELLMGGKWIENMPSALRSFGTGSTLGLPYILVFTGIVAMLGFWIARRTRLGFRIYALGSNPDAAAMRGVNVRSVKLAVFSLLGLAAGATTLFSATQLQVVESGFGQGFELAVIAAVIVGGTSIRGGRGGVLGTLLGAALLGIVSTALIFMKLGTSAVYWERAIQGSLILVAVLGDSLSRRPR